jgi:hypothetical protein
VVVGLLESEYSLIQLTFLFHRNRFRVTTIGF